MDILERLRQVAESHGGDFTPLLVLGFVLSTEGAAPTITIRAAAAEGLLHTLLTIPVGRRWLHDALDRLCDATRPPDDPPPGAPIKPVRVEFTEFPGDGTGFSE